MTNERAADVVLNIEGKLRRVSGKEFGFIARQGGRDVFISPQLLETLMDTDGLPIKARIIRGRDQKKGIIGWKALSVAEIKEVKDNVVVKLRSFSSGAMVRKAALIGLKMQTERPQDFKR